MGAKNYIYTILSAFNNIGYIIFVISSMYYFFSTLDICSAEGTTFCLK